MAFSTAEKLNRQGIPNHAATVIQEAIEGASGDVASAIATTPIIADGSVNGRPLEARLSESANILDYYQPTDSDMSAAMTRALATGKPIEIPQGSQPYDFRSSFTLPTGAVITGKGRPILRTIGASQRLFTVSGASDVVIKSLVLDGDRVNNPHGSGNRIINVTGGVRFLIEDVRYFNCRQGLQFDGGTVDSSIVKCSADDIDAHGVVISGDTTIRNTVTHLSVTDCLFGTLLTNGANRNEVSYCRTESNEIELIGMTYLCHLNRIIGNHAQGCGDNGISVTGFMNVVSNNVCYKNDHSGIALYGGLNACTGNVCMSNGQRYLVDNFIGDGITIHYGWGGIAYGNTLTGNICGDDQTVKTQRAGINLTSNVYSQWATGQAITATSSNARYYGNNIYMPMSSGTTGGTPPTHTSGTASDGGVDWLYIWTADPAHGASRNTVKDNTVFDTPGNRFANRLYPIYKQTANPMGNDNVPASWTTSSRPDAASNTGMIGLNTTTGLIEWSNGTSWVSPSVP